MIKSAKKQTHGYRRLFNNASGYLVVLVMVLTVVLGTIGLSIAQTVSVKYAKTKRDIATSSAVYVAEAGMSDTIAKLNTDPAFTGYAAKKTYYSNASKGKAEYTSVVSGSGSTRKVVATGYVYRTNDSTDPIAVRKIQVMLTEKTGGTSAGPATTPYTIYAGSAGIKVANSSTLFGNVSGPGDMYIKGTLSVTGNSDAPLYPFPFYSSSPAKMYVNNLSCISGTTYPVACSSSQPITVSADSAVNGIVCAPAQTTNTNISNTGLQSSCTSPALNDATFDKAAYTSTMTSPSKASSLAASRCSSTVSDITWTDRTTYTGDLDTSTRTCNIKIQGNVYIKGNLTLGASTKLVQPYALRNTPLTIVVDGTVNLAGAKLMYETNSSGSGTHSSALIRIISFASSDASCSTSNTCNTRLTSTARKTYETTANVKCTNECDASGALLWSYHGTVLVDTDSQTGMVNGQGISLNDSSTAGYLWNPGSTPNPAFGTGTTMPFGEYATDILGGTNGWEITDYRQIYD